MIYPQKFIKEIQKAYPDCDELHRKLENGDPSVGRNLYNGARRVFTIEEILEATSLGDLQRDARVYKDKRILYEEWCRLLQRP